VSDPQGVARLTRVAQPTGNSGLMPPPRPPAQTGRQPPHPPGTRAGVATLTPKAAIVEQRARALRQAMGRFATGVTIVGMTANAFMSVSLTPPLVLVSLGNCRMAEMLPRTRRYGVSVLASDQEHFADHFAARRSSPVAPEFSWHNDIPLLRGALAHLVCRVIDIHPAGDHVLWIGEVEHLHHADGEPLLFYTGRFGTLRELQDRADSERLSN